MPPCTTLTDLPHSVLHDILGRLPSSAAAVRSMGVCKALAVAVRALPEVRLAVKLELTLLAEEPERRYSTRRVTLAGTLSTSNKPPAPLTCKVSVGRMRLQRRSCGRPARKCGNTTVSSALMSGIPCLVRVIIAVPVEMDLYKQLPGVHSLPRNMQSESFCDSLDFACRY